MNLAQLKAFLKMLKSKEDQTEDEKKEITDVEAQIKEAEEKAQSDADKEEADSEKAVEDIAKALEEGKEAQATVTGQIGVLEKQIKELQTKSQPKSGKIPGVDEELEATGKEFYITRAMHAITTGDWKNAGLEREIMKAAAQHKDLNSGTGSAGEFLVPTLHVPQLIDILRANSVVLAMGATQISGLNQSPFEMPKQTGAATAVWIDENADITPSEQTLGQVTMTPNQLSALTKMSRRVLRLTNPGIEQMVRTDLAQQLARALDLAALRGSGVGSEPVGIANTAGINTVNVGPGAITYDIIAQHIFELENDNAGVGRLGYVMHPKLKFAISKLKDGDGRPLFGWDPANKVPNANLLGFPWMTTTQIPVNLGTGNDTELYYANWADLLIGEWFALELSASAETSDAFQKNQVWIRAIQEIDIAVRHEESFSLSNDITV